jgi:hypothetical protein
LQRVAIIGGWTWISMLALNVLRSSSRMTRKIDLAADDAAGGQA